NTLPALAKLPAPEAAETDSARISEAATAIPLDAPAVASPPAMPRMPTTTTAAIEAATATLVTGRHQRGVRAVLAPISCAPVSCTSASSADRTRPEISSWAIEAFTPNSAPRERWKSDQVWRAVSKSSVVSSRHRGSPRDTGHRAPPARRARCSSSDLLRPGLLYFSLKRRPHPPGNIELGNRSIHTKQRTARAMEVGPGLASRIKILRGQQPPQLQLVCLAVNQR